MMKRFTRFMSLTTAAVFLVNQIAFAAPGIGIEIAPAGEMPGFLQIDIPADLASLDDVFEAPPSTDPRLVLHIQNAHANYDAQQKIKKLLEYLNKNYAINTIFVEGAAEQLDPDYLKLFPDDERNAKLADLLARQGELTGAELYVLESDRRAVTAEGIEDAELYRKNYEALKKVYGAEPLVNKYVGGLESRLETISSKISSPDMRRMLAEWKKFEKGQREFMPYVKSLAKDARQILKLDLESLFAQVEWPQVTRLLVLQQMEKELDPARALTEKDALLRFMKEKRLPADLISAIDNFRDQHINVTRKGAGGVAEAVQPRYLLERLAREAAPKGFRFSDYPNFSVQAGYLILKSELDSKGLFAEINRLFDSILDKLAETPSQKELLALYRDGELVRKLLNLELTRSDWARIMSRKDAVAIDPIVERLKALGKAVNAEHKLAETSFETKEVNPKFRSAVTELYDAAYDFYDYARARESAFYKKMSEVMYGRSVTKVALVTGGFHTDGVSEILRQNEISYGILTPRLSEKSDEKLYRTAMLQNQPRLFDVSYLEMASKLMPLIAEVAQGVSIGDVYAVILNAMAKVGETDIDSVIAIFNDSLVAAKNGIRIVPAVDARGQPMKSRYKVVSRTAESSSVTIDGIVTASMGPLNRLSAPKPEIKPVTPIEVTTRSEVREQKGVPVNVFVPIFGGIVTGAIVGILSFFKANPELGLSARVILTGTIGVIVAVMAGGLTFLFIEGMSAVAQFVRGALGLDQTRRFSRPEVFIRDIRRTLADPLAYRLLVLRIQLGWMRFQEAIRNATEKTRLKVEIRKTEDEIKKMEEQLSPRSGARDFFSDPVKVTSYVVAPIVTLVAAFVLPVSVLLMISPIVLAMWFAHPVDYLASKLQGKDDGAVSVPAMKPAIPAEAREITEEKGHPGSEVPYARRSEARGEATWMTVTLEYDGKGRKMIVFHGDRNAHFLIPAESDRAARLRVAQRMAEYLRRLYSKHLLYEGGYWFRANKGKIERILDNPRLPMANPDIHEITDIEWLNKMVQGVRVTARAEARAQLRKSMGPDKLADVINDIDTLIARAHAFLAATEEEWPQEEAGPAFVGLMKAGESIVKKAYRDEVPGSVSIDYVFPESVVSDPDGARGHIESLIRGLEDLRGSLARAQREGTPREPLLRDMLFLGSLALYGFPALIVFLTLIEVAYGRISAVAGRHFFGEARTLAQIATGAVAVTGAANILLSLVMGRSSSFSRRIVSLGRGLLEDLSASRMRENRPWSPIEKWWHDWNERRLNGSEVMAELKPRIRASIQSLQEADTAVRADLAERINKMIDRLEWFNRAERNHDLRKNTNEEIAAYRQMVGDAVAILPEEASEVRSEVRELAEFKKKGSPVTSIEREIGLWVVKVVYIPENQNGYVDVNGTKHWTGDLLLTAGEQEIREFLAKAYEYMIGKLEEASHLDSYVYGDVIKPKEWLTGMDQILSGRTLPNEAPEVRSEVRDQELDDALRKFDGIRKMLESGRKAAPEQKINLPPARGRKAALEQEINLPPALYENPPTLLKTEEWLNRGKNIDATTGPVAFAPYYLEALAFQRIWNDYLRVGDSVGLFVAALNDYVAALERKVSGKVVKNNLQEVVKNNLQAQGLVLYFGSGFSPVVKFRNTGNKSDFPRNYLRAHPDQPVLEVAIDPVSRTVVFTVETDLSQKVPEVRSETRGRAEIRGERSIDEIYKEAIEQINTEIGQIKEKINEARKAIDDLFPSEGSQRTPEDVNKLISERSGLEAEKAGLEATKAELERELQIELAAKTLRGFGVEVWQEESDRAGTPSVHIKWPNGQGRVDINYAVGISVVGGRIRIVHYNSATLQNEIAFLPIDLPFIVREAMPLEKAMIFLTAVRLTEGEITEEGIMKEEGITKAGLEKIMERVPAGERELLEKRKFSLVKLADVDRATDAAIRVAMIVWGILDLYQSTPEKASELLTGLATALGGEMLKVINALPEGRAIPVTSEEGDALVLMTKNTYRMQLDMIKIMLALNSGIRFRVGVLETDVLEDGRTLAVAMRDEVQKWNGSLLDKQIDIRLGKRFDVLTAEQLRKWVEKNKITAKTAVAVNQVDREVFKDLLLRLTNRAKTVTFDYQSSIVGNDAAAYSGLVRYAQKLNEEKYNAVTSLQLDLEAGELLKDIPFTMEDGVLKATNESLANMLKQIVIDLAALRQTAISA